MQGVHLLIDGCADARQPLIDLERGKEFLSHVTKEIGMTIVLNPQGVRFPCTRAAEKVNNDAGSVTDETVGGYSAFVLLAESHISIHTYPEALRFSIDCYSCKDFDQTPVFKLLREYFGAVQFTSSMVERGVEQHIQMLRSSG